MDIGVTNAIQMGEHRHPRIGLHPRDQTLAPAWHDHVDQAGGGQHRPHHGAILRRHQLHGVSRRPRRRQTPGQRRQNRMVGMHRLAAPTQQHGIATAQTQRGGIRCHIGPALVYDADQANRHPHPAQAQPVGPLAGVDHLTHRVGQGGHLRHGIGNAGEALRRQSQPVEQGGGKAIGLAGGKVARVGGQNVGRILTQRLGSGQQRRRLLRIAQPRQLALRRAPGTGQTRHKRLWAFRRDGGRVAGKGRCVQSRHGQSPSSLSPPCHEATR